jgi:hypothetical protein
LANVRTLVNLAVALVVRQFPETGGPLVYFRYAREMERKLFSSSLKNAMLEAAFRTKNLHTTGKLTEQGQPANGAALYQRLCRLLQRHPNLFDPHSSSLALSYISFTRTELGFVPYADPAAYGGAAVEEDAAGDEEHGRPFFAWEGSLGMAFWALPPIYQHAWTQLIPLLHIPSSQQQV